VEVVCVFGVRYVCVIFCHVLFNVMVIIIILVIIGFDVDFYGCGYFLLGVYYSEGYQDVMGFCFYLVFM